MSENENEYKTIEVGVTEKRRVDIAQLKLEFFRYVMEMKRSDRYTEDIGQAAGEIAEFINFIENG